MPDSLVHLPEKYWPDLQAQFKIDWPRGISGYTVLETQRNWSEKGLDYGFKVFCPSNDVRNGMVALNVKDAFYEIIIQCPSDDTGNLLEALKTTKEIDWSRDVVVPFAPEHVVECIKRLTKTLNIKIDLILPSESFILDSQAKPYNKDIRLPQNVSFGPITPDYIDLVDSKWPHRYPGSPSYFQLLVKAQAGFGLFRDKCLISWLFINEAGTIGHMFTLEEHRRQGHAELLMKLVSNLLLEDGKDVFAFAVKENETAHNLYRKLGFKSFGGVAWCYLKGKDV